MLPLSITPVTNKYNHFNWTCICICIYSFDIDGVSSGGKKHNKMQWTSSAVQAPASLCFLLMYVPKATWTRRSICSYLICTCPHCWSTTSMPFPFNILIWFSAAHDLHNGVKVTYISLLVSHTIMDSIKKKLFSFVTYIYMIVVKWDNLHGSRISIFKSTHKSFVTS